MHLPTVSLSERHINLLLVTSDRPYRRTAVYISKSTMLKKLVGKYPQLGYVSRSKVAEVQESVNVLPILGGSHLGVENSVAFREVV